HVEWCQYILLPIANRRPEQLGELLVRHGQTGAIVEVVEIQPERPVGLEVDQMIENESGVFWLAVRREPHKLVLAGIDLKAGVIRESGIQQPKRVWEVQFLEYLQLLTAADCCRRGAPLADAVHREHRCLQEWRGVKRAGSVAQVMLGEQQAVSPVEFGRKPL